MKFCSHCGKEIMDEAIICPGCGCKTSEAREEVATLNNDESASKASVILGILGIVGGVLLAIVGHICSIISIIIGIIDCTKKKKPTGLILGIIGEIISMLSSIIGAVIGSTLF